MAITVEVLLLSLAIPFLCCGISTNFYIKPSAPDTLCPADFCLTLSEYASWVVHHNYGSNITMQLISGYHILERNYTVGGMNRFYLLGDTTSNSTTIVCQRSIGFSFSAIRDLQIQRLTFCQCGRRQDNSYRFDWYALFIDAVHNVEIVNSTFQDSFGSALGIHASTLHLTGSIIFRNNGITCVKDLKCTYEGGGIFMFYATLYFSGTLIFDHNSAFMSGGGIFAEKSRLNFTGTVTFQGNYLKGWYAKGGGIHSSYSSLTFSDTTVFADNSVQHCGGGIYSEASTISFYENTTFINSSAWRGGGVYDEYGTLNFYGKNTFINNSAFSDGGGFYFEYGGNHTFVGNTTFAQNSAGHSGGGMYLEGGVLFIDKQYTFIHNTADGGGAGMAIYNCILTLKGKGAFKNNHVKNSRVSVGGGIHTSDSELTFVGENSFCNNTANIDGGGIHALRSTLMFKGKTTFNENYASHCGGGIFADSSTLSLMGKNIFTKNSAEGHGAGVYADTSTVVFWGISTLAMGFAYHDGGGIYAEDSTLNFTGNTTVKFNRARIGGGAVSILLGSLNFTGEIHFINNSALRGGALYLKYKSSLRLPHKTVIHMVGNTAVEYGGAIYVQDVNPFGYCLPGVLPDTSEDFIYTGNGYNVYGTNCFFEPLENPYEILHNPSWHPKVLFSANFAQQAGHALFGGSVDNCKLKKHYAIANYYKNSSNAYNSIFLFEGNSNVSSKSMVSSEPFLVCGCVDGAKNCSLPHISKQVYPGETFILPAVTVGQRDGIVPSLVQASLENQQNISTSRVSMEIQGTYTSCSDLHITVFSSVSHEKLLLHTEGSCSVYGHPLHIALELLSCPPGFTLSEGECICETRLLMYTNSCNITERTVERDGKYWLGYDNETRGLILHPHCPFDYCRLDSIRFTLTESDSQCRHNRSGLLCGHCFDQFSLALGTNKCLKCSNLHILLLIAFASAGVALVLLLLVCKLTVAFGTINGLIFYANIIIVNRTAVFPPDDVNVLTVFIAFVNLDLGIETCFYHGLDAYAATWLQYAFPLYVWVMVGAMILISDYSSKFARMLGTNPVAVLSTLFLLSYTKILRTIIATFSFTILEYPHSKVPVWLYDGNIVYVHGKHIPLFISAILVLLIFFLPYTCILLLSQWFQAKSNRRIFSWVNHIRVKPFIEAYHAPYKNKFRYWTGLMLLLRCGLFLIFAFNTYGDPSVNLLAIVVTSFGAVWFIGRGQIYKYWWLDILEVSFFLNLGILAAGTLYIRAVTNGNQAALAYTSVSIAFITFLGIMVYHTYLKFKENLMHIFGQVINCNLKEQPRPAQELCTFYDSGRRTMIAPATTTIALRESLLQDTITS